MLPTTIEDFAAPVWVAIPELNDRVEPHAEVLLRPYNFNDRCELLAQFGICTVCGGSGEIRRPAQTPDAEDGTPRQLRGEPCRACDGKVDEPDMRADVRTAIIARTVRGWRNLRGRHPVTGEVREIAYSEKARDGLAAVLQSFYLVMGHAQRLGTFQDAEKKGSPTPLPVVSPTEDAPDGSVV